jgi:hypothetical protein
MSHLHDRAYLPRPRIPIGLLVGAALLALIPIIGCMAWLWLQWAALASSYPLFTDCGALRSHRCALRVRPAADRTADWEDTHAPERSSGANACATHHHRHTTADASSSDTGDCAALCGVL